MSTEKSVKSMEVAPNPEVKEPGSVPRKRKNHTSDYKLRILKEAEICRNQPGGIAALLRREGLYSSTLADWRKQRDSGALSALSKKRGPKQKTTAQELELIHLKTQNQRLEEKLRQANLIIEAQKKISEILGISTQLNSSDGEPS
jgi:transposase-like protein